MQFTESPESPESSMPSSLGFLLKLLSSSEKEAASEKYIVKYVEYTPVLFQGTFLVEVPSGEDSDKAIDNALKAVRHSSDDGQLLPNGKHAFYKDGYSICASMINKLSSLEYMILSRYLGVA